MLSCLTMLSCPRCGSGNLKDKKTLSMHLTWYCMDQSILFHAQRGTLAKKLKFNSLMVNCHSCFHLPWKHSTQQQMWHHICVILDTNCPFFFWNMFITSIHGLVYFHQNTKQVFKEFPKTKGAISLKQHQRFFLECIILIIVDDINFKVISITCIGFIQWCDGCFRALLFTMELLVYVDGFK